MTMVHIQRTLNQIWSGESLSAIDRPLSEPRMLKRLTLKRIDPLSAGKVFGILHLAYGLFIGFIYGMIGLVMAAGGGNQAGVGLAIAGGSILILPIVVGIAGFIAGILAAIVHNVGVGFVGGLMLEVEDDSEDDED